MIHNLLRKVFCRSNEFKILRPKVLFGSLSAGSAVAAGYFAGINHMQKEQLPDEIKFEDGTLDDIFRNDELLRRSDIYGGVYISKNGVLVLDMMKALRASRKKEAEVNAHFKDRKAMKFIIQHGLYAWCTLFIVIVGAYFESRKPTKTPMKSKVAVNAAVVSFGLLFELIYNLEYDTNAHENAARVLGYMAIFFAGVFAAMHLKTVPSILATWFIIMTGVGLSAILKFR